MVAWFLGRPRLSKTETDRWEVDSATIELTGLLGHGHYGEVYRGLWNDSTKVAVKCMNPETSTTDEFLAEAEVMKVRLTNRQCEARPHRETQNPTRILALQNIRHANLVQLLAVCTVGEPIFIIMEFLPRGALSDYLGTPEGEKIKLSVLVGMAAGIAKGMVSAHAAEDSMGTTVYLVNGGVSELIPPPNVLRVISSTVAHGIPSIPSQGSRGKKRSAWKTLRGENCGFWLRQTNQRHEVHSGGPNAVSRALDCPRGHATTQHVRRLPQLLPSHFSFSLLPRISVPTLCYCHGQF